jgi:hypothetical protein
MFYSKKRHLQGISYTYRIWRAIVIRAEVAGVLIGETPIDGLYIFRH